MGSCETKGKNYKNLSNSIVSTSESTTSPTPGTK